MRLICHLLRDGGLADRRSVLSHISCVSFQKWDMESSLFPFERKKLGGGGKIQECTGNRRWNS